MSIWVRIIAVSDAASTTTRTVTRRRTPIAAADTRGAKRDSGRSLFPHETLMNSGTVMGRMDLTKTYPRSVRAKWQGVVQLARTVDKAKAKAKGNIGEYHYNCPMDQAVFAFLGIDHAAFLDVVKSADGDAEVEAYTRPFVAKKSAEEIARWNREWLVHEPDNQGSRQAFIEMRNQVAPDRTDVTAWADLLDLEEKREVPRRTASTTA